MNKLANRRAIVFSFLLLIAQPLDLIWAEGVDGTIGTTAYPSANELVSKTFRLYAVSADETIQQPLTVLLDNTFTGPWAYNDRPTIRWERIGDLNPEYVLWPLRHAPSSSTYSLFEVQTISGIKERLKSNMKAAIADKDFAKANNCLATFIAFLSPDNKYVLNQTDVIDDYRYSVLQEICECSHNACRLQGIRTMSDAELQLNRQWYRKFVEISATGKPYESMHKTLIAIYELINFGTRTYYTRATCWPDKSVNTGSDSMFRKSTYVDWLKDDVDFICDVVKQNPNLNTVFQILATNRTLSPKFTKTQLSIFSHCNELLDGFSEDMNLYQFDLLFANLAKLKEDTLQKLLNTSNDVSEKQND